MWEKVLDIQLEYYNGVLIETKDGGCIFGVTVPSTTGHKDIYVTKLIDHGSIIWEKRIENKELEDLIETSDGGNAIAGTFHRDDQEGRINRDLYLAKLDAAGETTWELNYENGQDTQAASVIETSEHDFIVSGSNGAIDYFPYLYPYLAKFDQEGKKVWEKKDFDIGIGNLSRINQTDDGHYLLTGYANYRYINMGTQYSDEYLLKMDDDGNKLWEHTLAVNEGQRAGSAIQQLSDKSILALGKDYLNGLYYLTKLQTEEGDNTEVVSLSIDSKSLRLQAGEIKQLTLTAVYTDRQPADVTQKATWSSTDEKIVSVDEKGNVNAKKKVKHTL